MDRLIAVYCEAFLVKENMSEHKLKPIEIGYEKKYTFHPTMISIAEENELNQQFLDSSDNGTQDYQREYEICRDALGKYCAPATVESNCKGKITEKEINVAEEFKERTPENERIVRDTYLLWKEQLAPTARFLSRS